MPVMYVSMHIARHLYLLINVEIIPLAVIVVLIILAVRLIDGNNVFNLFYNKCVCTMTSASKFEFIMT